MNKITIGVIILIIISKNLSAQVAGINTRSTNTAAIVEVNSTNKGVLFPRLNITDKNIKAPVVATIQEGLLSFNTSNVYSHTLFYWDASANANAGAWNSTLYFKETPKIATIGLQADKSILDNAIKGGTADFFYGSTNPFKILNSGYLPGLGFKKSSDVNGVWGITLAEGTYIFEMSYLLSAPPADNYPDTQNYTYYTMGYFADFAIFPYTASTNSPVLVPVVPYVNANTAYGAIVNTGNNRALRTESGNFAQTNQKHRVRFIETFTLSGTPGQAFFIVFNLGRRLGGTFWDKVNILSDGTIFKITKLK